MRITARKRLSSTALACLISASCLAPQAALALAQASPARKPFPVQQAKSAKSQILQQYVAPSSTQAVLTLAASPQAAQPNQIIHFVLTWNRPVYRVAYHFDWGDGSFSNGTELAADHAYSSPGQYIVRVTARPAAVFAATVKAPNTSISSNGVAISIEVPEKPTVALSANRLNPHIGDT